MGNTQIRIAVGLADTQLAVRAEIFPTGWQTALRRPPHIEVQSIPLRAAPPGTASLALGGKKIDTFGFTFRDPASATARERPAGGRSESTAAGGNRAPSARLDQKTRLAPPDDVIKLEDRLYYLLQPPLEMVLTGDSFQLPLAPFPFQLRGVAFLYPQFSAILADEMGLGKSMQAITTIRLLLRAAEVRSVLLICPKPLVTNWQREFALWAPEVLTLTIEGQQHRRGWQWRLPDIPVKIANYELLMRDRDVITDPNLHFDLVVLDEAQRIKNRTSATSQLVRNISRRRSWALTGTPVENRPEDLVSIFEFLAPGRVAPGMTPRRLGRAVGAYVLRRTKQHVMPDLPPRLYRDAELELMPEQRHTYDLAESDGVLRLTEMGEALTIQHIFELVLRLKQICNFDPATARSAKLERLSADLEEVAASGQKAIVFSQWVETLTQLRSRLIRFGPLEYHGRVSSDRRERVIQQFRDNPRSHVLLMSYGAGSVGLNLQFAGYVFLFDRWWNPAVEDQAINRAHRIGVAGPVTVTRFLTLGTIEERINQILCEKRAMFEEILAETHQHSRIGLSHQEIFGLFNLSVPAGRIERAA